VIRLKTAREPFLPLAVLLNPVVGLGTAAVTCVFGTMIGLTVFVPLYYQVVLGLSAGQSGYALMPQLAGTVVGSTLAGRAMVSVRRYKRMAVAGLLLAIIGLVIIAAKPTGLALVTICGLMMLVGIGMGALFPVTTVSIQNAVRPNQLGTATGTMNFFRSLGGALMVSAFGTIVLGSSRGLTLDVLAAKLGRSAPDVANAFGWVFASAALALAVGLCCLLAMEERPLSGRPQRIADHRVPAD
jgi:MFS family permease